MWCSKHGTKKKVKSVPLQAWSGLEGSRKLGIPDFMTTAQDGGKVVSLTHQKHGTIEYILNCIFPRVTCIFRSETVCVCVCVCMCVCVCIYIYTHACGHAHPRIHSRTPPHPPTHTRPPTHARTHTHTHTHTHTCMHACTSILFYLLLSVYMCD